MPYSLVAWVTNQMHLVECLVVLTALVWWDAVYERGLLWWLPLLGFAVVAFLIKEDGIMLLPAVVTLHAVRRWFSDDDVAFPPLPFLALAAVLMTVLAEARSVDTRRGRGGTASCARRRAPQLRQRTLRTVPAGARGPTLAAGRELVRDAVPVTAILLWRRSTCGARTAMVSGLAIAMLFDLPFIFITKAEQLHFIALGAALFLTGSSVVVFTALRGRLSTQYGFGATAAAGLICLALVSQDIARDFQPDGPVWCWRTMRSLLDVGSGSSRSCGLSCPETRAGCGRSLSPDPSLALDLLTFGGHGPELSPDDVNYQWMAGLQVEVFLAARARAMTIPLRHVIEAFLSPSASASP